MKKIVYGVMLMAICANCTTQAPRTEPEEVFPPADMTIYENPTTQAPQPEPEEVFPPADKYIALTFDDGPLTKTGKLLDILRENGVTATFFLVGQNVKRRPDAVRRIIAEGHEIGNHSNDHSYLGRNSKLDENGIRNNITAAGEAVHDITGTYPAYFRAPYFDYSAALDTIVKELGMPFIGANVDPNDWENGTSTEAIVRKVLASARDGGIILMHEHYGGDDERTIRAIPIIALELRKQGFEIISVGELARKKGVNLEAGKRYHSIN